jgi:hypothetical protein
VNGNSSIDAALRCYPTWWRARYADEVRVVIDDLTLEGRSTTRVALDLLLGAVRVRARAKGMPKVYRLWATRTRLSIARATLSWLLAAPLVLIAMGSQSLHSSAGRVFPPQLTVFGTNDLMVMGRHAAMPAPSLAPAGRIVVGATLAITVLFLVTVVVLATGWIRFSGGIGLSSAHRRRVALLVWAPGFAVLAVIGVVIAQTVVRPTSYQSSGSGALVPLNGHPEATHVLAIVLPVVAIAGWLVSIVCVAMAAKRAEVAPKDLRFGRNVSIIVVSLFAALLAAYATWGVGLILQTRQASHGNFTTITYSNQYLWLPMVLLLIVALSLSAFSARAAARSWRVISLELL